MSTEYQTRKNLINKHLADAGWRVGHVTQVIEEFGIETKIANQFAEETIANTLSFSDYVLLGKDAQPLAVVEAKKTSVDPRQGEEQAKQYAQHIQEQYNCELPLCFYTNGYDIFFWNIGHYPPRKIYGFPSRADLERIAFIRKNKLVLSEEIINTAIAGRPYQIQAIRKVMEEIEAKRRKFLLVMATGTGKTRTVIALIDALMRAGWASRILFLVDRIELRQQAIDAFKEHTPNLSYWPHTDETKFSADRRVYISTYPTMLNIIESDKANLSPHFFDLIIVDESHRSIYNVYQNIITYFDAITLGLTATPTDVIDHNTFELFDCEDGLPTFAYTYEEALNNAPPYLSRFEVMKIQSKFQAEGIHQSTMTLDDQKRLLATGIDPQEINFEGSQIEKAVINKGTNALIVKEFMEECIKDEYGVLPGKTIFFCISKSHARRIKELFDQFYPNHTGELAKVIVSDDPRVYGKGGLLDQFRENDFPRIAISVDMMDTGIDVREVVNLVFAKPVFSYTKFWQMIGRGTRVLEEKKLKPWCKKKDRFLILDCWDNFEYFRLNPQGKEIQTQLALPVRLFRLRLQKIQAGLTKNNNEIVVKEINRLRKALTDLPQKNVVVMDARKELDKVNNDDFWQTLTEDKLAYLNDTIAPVMRAGGETEFEDMHFEKKVLETSIALLQDDTDALQYMQEVIVAEVQELPLTIAIVAGEQELIKQVQRSHWWATVTEEKLDELHEKLGSLMKYRRQGIGISDDKTYLNLLDFISKKETVEFGPQHEMVSITRYKEMAEQTIRELAAENLVLQKIRSGASVTDAEIQQLIQLLHERRPNITAELLQKVYDNHKAGFLQLIKHILGIEKLESFETTVSNAFETFIASHTNFSSRQIQFLQILQSFIIEKKKIEKADMTEAPFTQLHPEGILGIFPPKDIADILTLTEKIVA